MPPAISELELTRFRGLGDVALRELGRVNLVVGENNSGKTSVLEALALAANPLEPLELGGRRRQARAVPLTFSNDCGANPLAVPTTRERGTLDLL